MIKLFKRKPRYEYWIKLFDIKISEDFKIHKPRKYKMKQKHDWYLKHGEFQSPIRITRDFILVDGYTSYLLAKKFDLDKVPVYFED